MAKNKNFSFGLECRLCKEEQYLAVNQQDFLKFRSDPSQHVQNVFPYLDRNDREMLISRTCSECWEKMFGSEDDEY